MVSGRLPPLPHLSWFATHFPRAQFVRTGFGIDRTWSGRVALVNKHLCDKFVKALKIRENEVIVDVFAGHGAMTRSLLAGGDEVGSSQRWEQAAKSLLAVDYTTARKGGTVKSPLLPFAWLEDREAIPKILENLKNVPSEVPGDSSAENAPGPTVKPRLVVAFEPSASLLIRGLGVPEEYLRAEGNLLLEREGKGPERLYQSTCDPRLRIVCGQPYYWNNLPAVIEHEDIAEDLVASGTIKIDTDSPDKAREHWQNHTPHLTLVIQPSHKPFGESLVSQWIASVIGAAEGEPTWIWKWGRVRLAVLVSKTMYDRMMAQPGELSNSKLSILTHALYDVKPLPPRHHSPNVLNKGRKVKDELRFLPSQSAREGDLQAYYDAMDLSRDETWPLDFNPSPWGESYSSKVPLERPDVLGLLLEPKVETVITSTQRYTWEYVLRKCMAKPLHPISRAIHAIGFGADKLIPLIESVSSEYKGDPVGPKEVARDMSIAQWARVVDVVDKWKYKPVEASSLAHVVLKSGRGGDDD
ncbi:hypothetical protein BD324DRAFT_615205 [Kockovaella imperatae]|uniref:rRNA adenine N(6)-methyltransferase n=1 Tax=Kockovaella imperatae TaxID=4999 RepID=A0A1Y1UP69_9TREE|nr:hypothetical protein BD324DRAFT_615205 [Kockovaella imperatae]ORX39840.1 hypothetical protein BD324DRAFT_615205 [Kockovaella imperatae]